jgi:glycogen operon protein
LRHSTFLTGQTPPGGGLPDVSWFDPDGRPLDWKHDDSSMVCLLGAWSESPTTLAAARKILILAHAGDRQRSFQLPDLVRASDWRLFMNTEADSPHDIYPEVDGPPPPDDGKVTLAARSLVCYVSAE